jgi:hypothetical protein
MMKMLPSMLAVIAVGVIGACSSSSGGSGVASSSSGGSSGTGTILGGGALDGTWDVVITNPKTGGEASGSITISPSLFAMSFEKFELNGALNAGVPDITYNTDGETKKLGATLSQVAFDTGALSYPIGGDWVLKGESQEGCTANIKIPTMSLECDRTPSPLRSGIDGTSSAQRVSTLPSSFGELGGKWNVLVPDATCEATFEGSTFTAKCSEAGREKGTLTMTFSGDTASGSITDAVEISAKRR